ncbi:uncharacterized protein n4bp2l2 [Pholidichthys leucotaenia]
MSHSEFSCNTSNATEKPGVDENMKDCQADSADTNMCGSNDGSSSVRERVLKEVGLTSTKFIGPALPPVATTAKPDIEDSLSEFYKELTKIDTLDGANGNPGKQDSVSSQRLSPLKLPTSKETEEVLTDKDVNVSNSAETDGYQKASAPKQTSWPHWHQNEPYYPRRQRLNPEPRLIRHDHNQWHLQYPPIRPPNPTFLRPPYPPHPPPVLFLDRPNLPPHLNPTFSSSGMINQYQDEPRFPTFSSVPPPNICSSPSQGFYSDPLHQFNREEQYYCYDSQPDNANVTWSRDGKEDRDRLQRFDSEDEQWERQHHFQSSDNTNVCHSAAVLILMRGLPGSGKSTLARELLSTGPSGIILSTDDYFELKCGYRYDPGLLGAAHEWNQSRAKDALSDGRTPIIIDNTNLQAWEMKPYVKMALEKGYHVDFCEPDTRWKFDPYELEKRNKHGVPHEKIAQMMDRFSFPISIDIVMSSQEPAHVNQRRRPEQTQTSRKK